MQPFFHSFKAAKHIFGVIKGAQGSLCADRPTGCSGLIRVLATMNRVPVFVLLFAECKMNIPGYPKSIDSLHLVKKKNWTKAFHLMNQQDVTGGAYIPHFESHFLYSQFKKRLEPIISHNLHLPTP